MSSDGAVVALLAWWTATNVPWLPPADEAVLVATEARLGMRLPNQLRRFYEQTSGTGGNIDKSFIIFWPLERLERDPLDGDYVRFADLLCECDYRAINVAEESPEYGSVVIAPYGERAPFRLAESFEEFLNSHRSGLLP